MRAKWGFVPVCIGFVLFICAVVEAKNDSGVKTIRVDCNKGGSINEALKDSAKELIIEIRGVCRENVTVSRDWVTLRGNDPAVDGIESQMNDPYVGGLTPAVVAWRANGVVLENLTLRGGISTIGDLYYGPTDVPFAVSFDLVHRVTNCTIEGGAVNVSVRDGYLSLTDVAVRDSHMYGIYSHRGQVECLRCSVETSEVPYGAGVSLSNFSRGYFTDSTITASGATSAFEMYVSSRTWLIGCHITTDQDALISSIGSHLGINDTEFSGSLSVGQKSQIRLARSQQTSNPSANTITGDSILEVYSDDEPSTLRGPLVISSFGRAVLSGITVDGDLECSAGGDAVALSAVTITGSISGCDHLPAP